MESDATVVTGGSGGRTPRRGDVLAERYEIVDVLEVGPLVCTYRGVDQESEAAVLLRGISGGLLEGGALGEKDARHIVQRLEPLVGVGGRVLSQLRDVDREGTFVFTVEAWPRGTSLRAVLDGRRAKGGVFEPREVLPVLARLAAALASIPEPWWHGEVRAERVWVDPDGLVLTGGLLVAALPGEVVARVLSEHEALRQSYAPEVSEGLGGRSADRWGVAAIAWEALTGRPVGSGPPARPRELGPAASHLARLLDPDPASRPRSLDGLLAALADLAHMPLPRIEPDPFPVRSTRTEGPTRRVVALAPVAAGAVGGAPDAPNAGASDTLELPLDDEARTSPGAPALADDTAPHAALGPDGKPIAARGGTDLDPRLVRAALAPDAEELNSGDLQIVGEPAETTSPADDLDPRLVRAALGVALEDSGPRPASGTAAPPHGAATRAGHTMRAAGGQRPAPARNASVTQEIDATDLEELHAPVGARAASGLPAGRKRPVKQPEPVPLPDGIKPIPRPRPRDGVELPAGPVLFDASRPAPPTSTPPPQPVAAGLNAPAPVPVHAAVAPAPHAAAPASPAAAPAPHAASAPRSTPSALAVAGPQAPPLRLAPARAVRTHAPARRSGTPWWTSWLIVAGALLLGVAIVAAGFWYRSIVQREAERRQRIEERLRQIQQEP